MARAFQSTHWTFLRLRTVLAAVTLLALVAPARAELVVYTAQLIRTMEPTLPTATAVAVEDGLIVAVGSEDSLQPLIEARKGRVDRQFANDILHRGLSILTCTQPCRRCSPSFRFWRPMTGRCPPASSPARPPPRDIGPA